VIGKLDASSTEATLGKVFFSTASPPPTVLRLQSCERVMALVLQQEADAGSNDQDAIIRSIVATLTGPACDWADALRTVRAAGRFDSEGGWTGKEKPVTFRISAKLAGDLKDHVGREALAQACGAAVAKHTGWGVELRRPGVEVVLQLSKERLLVALPLSRDPVSKTTRVWATSGLRGPVAWALGKAAKITAGSYVLDPMCGAGTCLIEAAKAIPNATYVGVDWDPGQVRRCEANMAAAGLEGTVSVSEGDAGALGLVEEGIVDALVCDMPFDQQHACDIREEYPRILQEMGRVAKDNALAALLTATACLPLTSGVWDQEEEPIQTSLGATGAYLHVLRRKPRGSSRGARVRYL